MNAVAPPPNPDTSLDDIFVATSDAEFFDGGEGFDTVDYSGSLESIDIRSTTGTGSGGDAEGDTFSSIESIIGSDIASGRDFIYSGDEDNVLLGLAGADVLQGGEGADIIDGGDGRDYARYSDSDEAVTINLATNVNTGGTAEGDLLYNIEAITGSSFGDTLLGSDAREWFYGNRGDDLIYGGLGRDELTGGEGADTFLFLAESAFEDIDNVRDFDISEGDHIDISDLLSEYDPLTDAISDFLTVTNNGNDSLIAVDVDGGGDNFVTVARVRGVADLEDAEILVDSGNLIV